MLTKHTYVYNEKCKTINLKKKKEKEKTPCILRKKMQRKKNRRQEQLTRAVAVNRESFCFFFFLFFSISEHVFTCSGGGFCPGLGEEELEVAAAGLVGLCCFAKRIRNFIILTKLNRLSEPGDYEGFSEILINLVYISKRVIFNINILCYLA